MVLKCREVGKGEALRTLAGLNTVVIIFRVAMVLGIVADAVEGGVRDEEQAEVRQESDAPGMRLAPMTSRVPPESDGVRRRCAVALGSTFSSPRTASPWFKLPSYNEDEQ